MIHLQIKAKSGLHAGAFWRLDQSHVSMGAHPNSEVFLCDPDVPDNLITLERVGRRFEIASIHPEVRINSSDMKKVEATLFPSQLVSLDFRHIQLELEVANTSFGLTNSLRDGASKSLYRLLQILRGLGAKAIVTFLFIMSVLLTAVVLLFGTAGVAKSQPRMLKPKDPIVQGTARVSMNQRILSTIDEELKAFSQRMETRDISISRDEKSVEIKAQLTRLQLVNFEKLLTQITQDYGKQVSIKAVVNLTDEQLAVDKIDVEQIVLGSKPVLVLRDGERLYLGADYNGVKLVAIQPDKAVFRAGDSTYEVLL